ncbi:hypothetical protein Tco_0820658 [Tanacetum coccineum]|uniref:Uncharacterized protein n=1 Tax=Tanacetum coccineum TaxID=301880 RepID=A0ABQ5AEC6_9ASTR
MRLEAAKGDSRWDALVISPRDGYFDPMEFYSAPSSEPRGEDDAVASPNAFNASSVPVDSVLSADFWFHPRILPSVRKATDAAKSADGLSSVISIDLADQVFEGIGARQLVVKKEPAFFNPPEEKVLLYTHRGELPSACGAIVIRRADQKLNTFKEGDFPRHHLNDIEDMLLLHVQNKLFNLEGDAIVNLAVALRMFK